MLTEEERQIARDDDGTDRDSAPARSLVGSRSLLRSSATVNRTILGDVGATLNGEVEHNRGRSLFGLPDVGLDPLSRRTNSTSGHLGSALNWDMADWRLSSTANADIERSTTRSDRRDGLRDRPRQLHPHVGRCRCHRARRSLRGAGGVARHHRQGRGDDRAAAQPEGGRRRCLDHFARPDDGARLVERRPADLAPRPRLCRARQSDAERQCRGGAAVGFRHADHDRRRRQLVAGRAADLARQLDPRRRRADDPAARQSGAEHARHPHLRLHARRDGAGHRDQRRQSGPRLPIAATSPSSARTGNRWPRPICGCAPNMCARELDRPVSSFPGVSAALEAAFPERFVRDAAGELVSVDFRPVNYDRAKRDTLRIGFDFSKPLRSARPSQAQIDAFRARARAARPAAAAPNAAVHRPRASGRRAGGGGRWRWRRRPLLRRRRRRAQRRTPDLLGHRHDHLGRRSDDPVRAAQARLSERRRASGSRAAGRGTRSRRKRAIPTTGSARGCRPITAAARASPTKAASRCASRRWRPSTCGCSPTWASGSTW